LGKALCAFALLVSKALARLGEKGLLKGQRNLVWTIISNSKNKKEQNL
jgi:NADH:ubiquinone oxidoreductase subunit K